MFVLRASTWLSALEEFRPDIDSASKAAWNARKIDQAAEIEFVRPDQELFTSVPNESIDYAVIEKCPGSKYQVKMVELNAGWNDLGSWDAVWQSGKQDINGNLITGDVITSNSKNSLIHSTSRLVSTIGIEGLIIIETADAVLIADQKHSQDVKHIVGQLDKQKREEKNLHRKVPHTLGLV
jgi:mannose-1-phosphate guanylyltransferase/mannose-6-phosphate isomerase